MRVLCVGGVADGRTVDWEGTRPYQNVREPLLDARPVQPGEVAPEFVRQEPYKLVSLYFKGYPLVLCAAPVASDDANTLRLLTACYPRRDDARIPL